MADMDQTERDLLIQIDTKLNMFVTDMHEYKSRLRDLELRPLGNPVVADNVNDHESRLRALEKWRWLQIGLSAATGAVVGGGGDQVVSTLFGG